MSTEAQIRANQHNAERSTGPKTEDGKAASCMNNFRWGLTGSTFQVLDWEDQEEYDLLASGLRHDLQPRGFTEQLLIEKMAQAQWLAKRALELQALELRKEAFKSLEHQERRLGLFIRYHATHERAFHRLLHDLLKLRAEKRRVENGFESQPQKAAHQEAAESRRQAQESRREAAEKRRQELHEFAVLLAQRKLDHQMVQNVTLDHTKQRSFTPETRSQEAQQAA